MQYLPISWSFQITTVTSSKSQCSKIKVTACSNLLNAFCLPIPDLLFGKENLPVHTVCSPEPLQHFLLPKKKTAQSHRVHILHLCGGKKKGKNGGVEGCLMQWKSYTDNSKATAEAYLGSLEKGREPSSVFCIERVTLVSFAPGGNEKAKIISHPKGIVCICNHLKDPPRQEINCIKAKPVFLFLGDMLHFQTKRFWVPSVVWVMGPRGAL